MIAFYVNKLFSYSGAALQAFNLATQINEQTEVIIFNLKDTKNRDLHNKNKIRIINLHGNPFLRIFSIIYYTLKYHISINHYHGWFPLEIIIGIILRRHVILKTTLVGDDDFSSLTAKTNKKFFLKIILKRIAINIVLTAQMKKINQNYIKNEKILHLPNSFNFQKLSLKNEKEALTFCIVGLLSKRKRTVDAIKYFIQNYSENEKSKLYLVGPTSNQFSLSEIDQDYLMTCKDIAKDLQTKIIFTGFLNQNELFQIYALSKVLLFFSEREGMSNVLLEAMAHNCVPIVLNSNYAATNEIITHGINGFIINQNEKVEIGMIENIFKSMAPQQTIYKDYNMTILVEKYLTLYKSLN